MLFWVIGYNMPNALLSYWDIPWNYGFFLIKIVESAINAIADTEPDQATHVPPFTSMV